MRLAIAHQVAGRTRLRVQAGSVADAAALQAFADRLAGLSGVEVVDCRPTTGSLVVEHPDLDADALAAGIAQCGGVFVPMPGASPARPGSLMPVRRGLESLDGMLSQITAGSMDMRALVFLTFVGLALRQIMRGQVMVPAVSLLWWAFELLPRSLPEAAGEHADDDATAG